MSRMEGNEDAPEAAAVKAWLADLLQTSGLSKAALARELKVEPKTIYNAFGDGSKLPRGLTFYRLLRELGALKDPPGESLVSTRLAALETAVAKLATDEDLQRGLEVLRKAIDAQANRGTRQEAEGG